MNLVNDIFSMLDCENDIELQNRGIELANNINEIGEFILPMHPVYNKAVHRGINGVISV